MLVRHLTRTGFEEIYVEQKLVVRLGVALRRIWIPLHRGRENGTGTLFILECHKSSHLVR